MKSAAAQPCKIWLLNYISILYDVDTILRKSHKIEIIDIIILYDM